MTWRRPGTRSRPSAAATHRAWTPRRSPEPSSSRWGEHQRRHCRAADLGSAGPPCGPVGYRAVNTLDAMIGHHSPNYEHFGMASARLDESPTGYRPGSRRIAAACSPAVSGGPGITWQIARDYGPRHPSPNAAVRGSVRRSARLALAACLLTPGALSTDRRSAPDAYPRPLTSARRFVLAAPSHSAQPRWLLPLLSHDVRS